MKLLDLKQYSVMPCLIIALQLKSYHIGKNADILNIYKLNNADGGRHTR